MNHKIPSYAPIPNAAITSCPGTSRCERMLLGRIADYDRISFSKGEVAGCYAKLKTLAEEIDCPYGTIKKMVAKLCEKGLLVNLGLTGPGGSMRRRVVLPQTHIDAFYAKRDARKKQLWSDNEDADRSASPGELRKAFSNKEKESVSCRDVVSDRGYDHEGSGIHHKVESGKKKNTTKSPQAGISLTSIAKTGDHKKRDWLSIVQTYPFFPALQQRFNIDASTAQTIVKKIESGKICQAKLGFVLETFGRLNKEKNPAYPNEPYRPATVYLLLKNFEKILAHLQNDKREEVVWTINSEHEDVNTAQESVVQAINASRSERLHNPVGSQDAFAKFGTAEMLVLLASVFKGERSKFLSLVCPARKDAILQEARNNPIGFYEVAKKLDINLVEVLGMAAFEDMLLKNQARIDYLKHCRNIVDNLQLWTPGAFKNL